MPDTSTSGAPTPDVSTSDVATSDASTNMFLDGPLAAIYARTALPIIFVMGMNGLLAVADALFLGHYVGPQALAAVTLMFPIYMLIVALSTLVSSGMSSLLARHLGGRRLTEARMVFAGAHGLALVIAAVLLLLFAGFGRQLTELAAGGSVELAHMGLTYLRITVLFSPLLFVLSVNSDTLRNEGRVGFMAAMSLLVSLANIGFNYVLIAIFELGVAGSAYGTALAQALAFAIILAFRFRGRTALRPSALLQHGVFHGWGRILALGAPQSLNFIGLALGSAAIMMALQILASPDYAETVSAYGIITRVMTFAFLPLLGLSHAMQTITGNNFGARQWRRSDGSLKLAVSIAFAYCAALQLVMTLFARGIGGAFVDNPAVVAEVGRILPVVVTLFVLAGPLMMIATYFQAIGEAARAALLGLAKPYLFAIPLTFLLSAQFGEIGIWSAGPVAEALLLALTLLVLTRNARRHALRLGLFRATAEDAA
ncbi:MATE family efflux transporter [Stappia indica]|uniref:MATE family efflux transporter n=1 Tax=Stappia indica TaxID=538381 RepID=UPI001CD1FFC7|nr:MATE family efflux transporter [Stappia indica]MCA1300659.1 MATE family efflux transporter [Stappia indica]